MPTIKEFAVRTIGGSKLFSFCLRTLEHSGDRRGNLLRVLTYHRVANLTDRPELDPAIISSTPERFAGQLQWIAREFEPVSQADIIDCYAGNRPLPPRAILLTFDDAYRDFAEHAWPSIRAKNIPVILFVPTAYPGEPELSFWWDRLHNAVMASDEPLRTPIGNFDVGSPARKSEAIKSLKHQLKSLPHNELLLIVDQLCEQRGARTPTPTVLDWNALRRLTNEGVTLGAHTRTHPLLNRISEEESWSEIVHSRDLLAEQVGVAPKAFAYPSGFFDTRVVEQVREAGFELAFTTVRGITNLPDSDPLRIRRTNVGFHTPDAVLRAQLTIAAKRFNPSLPHAFPANEPSRHIASNRTELSPIA